MPRLTFTADVDATLAEEILRTGRTRFDLATIFANDGDTVIADYIEVDLSDISPHWAVGAGRCSVCGHYGEDCTGRD